MENENVAESGGDPRPAENRSQLPAAQVPRQATTPSGDGWIVLSLYGDDDAWQRRRVVLMCHGFTGNRMEHHRIFVRMARQLTEAGLAVATFDYRGNGESSGDFENMTVSTLIQDATSAVDFLKNRVAPAPLRLGVLGYSMGGLVASYLTKERPKEIECVVLWAAVACATHVLNGFLGCTLREALETFSFPLERDGWRLGRRFFEEVNATCSSRVLAESGKPTLILHARDDQTVNVDNATEFSKALTEAGVDHDVALLRHGGHGFILREIEEELFQRTREYFAARLG